MHLYFPTKTDINGDQLPMLRRPTIPASVDQVEVNNAIQSLSPGFILQTLAQTVYSDDTNWWIIGDANYPRKHPGNYKMEDIINIPLISDVQNIDDNTKRQRVFRAL